MIIHLPDLGLFLVLALFGVPDPLARAIGAVAVLFTIGFQIGIRPSVRDAVLFHGVGVLNLVLGVFLIKLRPHDLTARLPALGD